MAFQAVPLTARFDCVHDFASIGGQPAIEAMVSFYVRHIVGEWTQLQLQAMAEQIGGSWAAFVGDGMNVNWTFDRVEARDLSNEFGPTATAQFNTAGTSAGEAASSALATLVTLQCGTIGPPRKGLMYVPGLSESMITGNDINDATVSDVAEGVDTVRGAIVGGNDTPVRVSRYSKAFVTPENPRGLRPVGLTNVHVSTSARTLVAVQRRRRD